MADVLAVTGGHSGLQMFWFATIAVLWCGYFFLEGFDFGVGMLLPVVGRDDLDRRVLVNTIGPVWDGNEVWLIVAGGATFAAFPTWYATLFSGFYLPLFLILLALIVRGVAFELRSKRPQSRWRQTWDHALFWGSLVPSLLWGVAFANMLRGVPIGPHFDYLGSFFNLLNPYALVGGATTLLLFALHGATFLSLRTTDDIQSRARRAARTLALPALAALAAFLSWTYVNAHDTHHTGLVPPLLPVAALVAVAVVSWLLREHLDGWAFVATAVGVVGTTATVFLDLYPRVMVSSISPAYSLTIANAASAPYTLRVMTIVALVFTPLVLLYQGWTYWVFRSRLGRPGGRADEDHDAGGPGGPGGAGGPGDPGGPGGAGGPGGPGGAGHGDDAGGAGGDLRDLAGDPLRPPS